MTKEQVFEVLVLFRETYNNFHFDQSKINIWHDLLKDKDPEVIKQNARELVLNSKFPPSLSELVNKVEEIPSGPAVPTVEETQEIMRRRAENKRNAARPEVIEAELAKIRKILNIPDEDENDGRASSQ
ncbi:replicative helicase loader/inhibitor [Rossellomorea vietnamensis]|uniref:replicative helicase loader/inhibitor n=1 Tax=Rossellomorea vietnamensis TaxID=218284 RepID=UPI003CF591AE